MLTTRMTWTTLVKSRFINGVLMAKDALIQFRVSKEEKDRFEARVPTKVKRANTLRGLLQMYLEGKIGKVTYTQVSET